jgi:hypothetical protein
MCKDVTVRAPHTYSEWLSSNFWFSLGQNTIGHGFSRQRAMILYNQGLPFNRDVWMEGLLKFMTGPQVASKFGLYHSEFCTWDAHSARLVNVGIRLLRVQPVQFQSEEWIGLYSQQTASLPSLVFHGHALPDYRLSGSRVSIPYIRVPDDNIVQSHSLKRVFFNINRSLFS